MSLPGFVTCPTCGGEGIEYPTPSFSESHPLPVPCPDCVGGQRPTDETVEAVQDVLWDLMEARTGPKMTNFARAALLEYARHTQKGER